MFSWLSFHILLVLTFSSGCSKIIKMSATKNNMTAFKGRLAENTVGTSSKTKNHKIIQRKTEIDRNSGSSIWWLTTESSFSWSIVMTWCVHHWVRFGWTGASKTVSFTSTFFRTRPRFPAEFGLYSCCVAAQAAQWKIGLICPVSWFFNLVPPKPLVHFYPDLWFASN